MHRKKPVIGGAWLCLEYGIDPVQPLRYVSTIGGTTVRRESNGRYENTFLPVYEPEPSLAGHLEFMIKHERIHLELLSRLFRVAGGQEIARWAMAQPTGQYSRRAAWLYEWLTGIRLDVPDARNAPYVPAFEPDRYWTAPEGRRNARWRVLDNAPAPPPSARPFSSPTA